jgi:cytidylate kinase
MLNGKSTLIKIIASALHIKEIDVASIYAYRGENNIY